MKSNRKAAVLWVATLVLTVLSFSGSSFAQWTKTDTAINPHDFTKDYYFANGVVADEIIGRRTGTDGFSVFSYSSDPRHTSVRIIATHPAYNSTGTPVFTYVLGTLSDQSFTADKAGVEARELAKREPIYIFPLSSESGVRGATRQSPVIDDTWSLTSGRSTANPLGIHIMFSVNYTKKAFTKEGSQILDEFRKRNGVDANGTPIIKSVADIQTLSANGLVTVEPVTVNDGGRMDYRYLISPVIPVPNKGVIAKDAFLVIPTFNGTPLAAEQVFVDNFSCIQQTFEYCK